MSKVQNVFGYGQPGAVTRSIDDVIISIKNTSEADIPFGTPVFLDSTNNGAVPFDTSSPQEFTDFLGFAVRVADKTPPTYPLGQFPAGADDGQAGVWHPGDVMEVLVRGSIAVMTNASGAAGGKLYIRKSDGALITAAGASGTSVLLENVRIRKPRKSWSTTCEAIVNTRNIL